MPSFRSLNDQAEKTSRYWKAQHALVERKLAELTTAKDSQQSGGRSCCGDSQRASVVADGTTNDTGPAGVQSREPPFDHSSCNRTEDISSQTQDALPAAPRGLSVAAAPRIGGTLDGTDSTHVRGYPDGDERGDRTGGGGGGSGEDIKSDDRSSVSPGASTVKHTQKEDSLQSWIITGGGVETGSTDENITESPATSTVDALGNGNGGSRTNHISTHDDNGSSNHDNNTNDRDNNTNVTNNSPQQQLTFKERRAVFSSNDSVPAPPAAQPWAVAARKKTATTKPTRASPPSSLPRAWSRTPPPLATFSSAAVEAARQSLKRNKTPAERGLTPASRGRKAADSGGRPFREAEAEAEAEGGRRERSRASSHSRSPSRSAASVSRPPLSRGSSSAAYSSSSAPFTPPRSLYRRGTGVPSPPVPSSCSTADQYRTTPAGSPDAAGSARPSAASAWSSSFGSPGPSSDAYSPSLASPPSLRPNAERRRGWTQSTESDDDPTTAPEGSSTTPEPKMGPGEGRRGMNGGVDLMRKNLEDHHHHYQQQQQQQQQQHSRGQYGTEGGMGLAAAGHASFSATASRSRSPPVSPAQGKLVLSSSSSVASAIRGASSAASRLPPTAPSVPRAIAPRAGPAAGATPPSCSSAATTSASTPSPSVWSGVALRQKGVRVQRSSPASVSLASAASSPPSLVPEGGGGTGAASRASRVAGEGEKGAGFSHARGSDQDDFSTSKGLLAWPPGGSARACPTFQGGEGGAKGDWNERSAGVGPWPLLEQTREGRASLDEKRRVSNGGAVGTGFGQLPARGNDGTKPPAAAAVAVAADPEVSIGSISTMPASKLRTLRAKMGRRYSWVKGTTPSTTATATSTVIANTAATIANASAATVSDGFESRSRPAGRDQGQPPVVGKPWGSRPGTTVGGAHRTST